MCHIYGTLSFPHNLPMGMNQGDTARSRDSLPLRLATAAVGIPILAVAVWLGGIPLLLVAAAVTFLAIWELRVLLQPMGRVVWPVSALLAGAFLLSASIDDASPVLIALTVIGGGTLGAALFAFRLRTWSGAQSWFATVIAAVYPAAFLAAGLLLREEPDGLVRLSYAILITFASDTAAYAVGKLIGRHRLAPAISPGKTWEGAIGGIIGAAAASAVFVVFTELDALPLATAIALGAGLSVLGQLGDLGESWLKRTAGVKDSGRLFPGHGGVLDRLDSLLPILPAVFVYVTIITTME